MKCPFCVLICVLIKFAIIGNSYSVCFYFSDKHVIASFWNNLLIICDEMAGSSAKKPDSL